MITVHEVSALSGVTIRTLRYYDRIGLLKPAARTEAGYRLYDDADLMRLQRILLLRELEIPLRDVSRLLKLSETGQREAIGRQITLLELKKEHLDNLISLCADCHEKRHPEKRSKIKRKTMEREKAHSMRVVKV